MNKSAKYFILTELVLGILVAVLAALMLIGRLEIFGILLLFYRGFWKAD